MKRNREITTTEQFFAHALAIEAEAAERYRALADQMRTHHNLRCARLFDHLATLEDAHTAGLKKSAHAIDLSKLPPWSYHWSSPESPEAVPFDRAHYLMTEHHALMEALESEKRAKDFFDRVAAHSPNPDVHVLALQFAAEEQRHIEMIAIMLRTVTEPDESWAEDHDGPIAVG